MSKTHPKHIIVMTGATSGIGEQAVKQLAASPDTLILTGVRGIGRTVPGAEVFPLDPEELAHPSKAGSGGMRAYAASKLCNLLTARSFAVLDDVKHRTNCHHGQSPSAQKCASQASDRVERLSTPLFTQLLTRPFPY